MDINRNQINQKNIIVAFYRKKKKKSQHRGISCGVSFSIFVDSSHRNFKAEAERARHGRTAIITMR